MPNNKFSAGALPEIIGVDGDYQYIVQTMPDYVQ